MYSSKNASAVQDELQLLDGIFNQMIEAVTDSKEGFEDAEYKHVEDWFDEIDEKLCTFKRKVHNWLKDAMREMEDKKLSSKGSSHSQRSKSSKSSHRSSRSSTKEKAIAEKMHLAELLAEASFMEKRRNVEYEAEPLQLQEKLEKTKARTKIYEEYDKQSIKDEAAADNQNVGKNLNQYYPQKPFEHQSEMFTLDANAKPFHLNKQYNPREKVEGADQKRFSSNKNSVPSLGVKQQQSTKDKVTSPFEDTGKGGVIDILCQLLRQQAAPEVQIDVFNGNPLNFKYFMALFKEVVETKIEDPHGRLTRLIRYTSGEVKQLIKHCIELPLHLGYNNAIRLLYKRYGDPHKLLAAHRAEIRKWPIVKVGDAEGFRKFHNFLIKCQSIMNGNNWNIMDSPETICMLLSKLPGHMRDRWNRELYTIRTRFDKGPALPDLISFVDKETILVNDPLFSKEAVDQCMKQKDRNKEKLDRNSRRRGVKNYSVLSKERKD